MRREVRSDRLKGIKIWFNRSRRKIQTSERSGRWVDSGKRNEWVVLYEHVWNIFCTFQNADVGCWWRVGRQEQRLQVSAMRREVRSDRLKGIKIWFKYLFCYPFAISGCTDSNREAEEQEEHTSHHEITCSAWTKNESLMNSTLNRPCPTENKRWIFPNIRGMCQEFDCNTKNRIERGRLWDRFLLS